LENRSAFDVAFELELEDGGLGVIGIETKYHEHCKCEKTPSEQRRFRNEEVARNAGIFKPDALNAILGKDLQQIWLDHLLALSMLQHPSRKWRWAKFVLVCPSQNPSYARAFRLYEQLILETKTVEIRTIESLLERDVLPDAAVAAFRERYFW